jgi:TP901 family phage tail tape measure protein
MNKVEKSTVQLIIDGQQSKVSLAEMGASVRQLKKELRGMKEADDPKAWEEKARQVKIASKAYADATARIQDLSAEGKKFKASWKDVFTGFLGGSAVTYGVQQLGNVITAAKDKIYTMSDSLSDVSKATDLSAKDVRKLNSELAGLDTRTATADLRDMAIVAGKNGIQKDLAGFVKSVDQVNIAFGDEFSNATELTETIINLRKIFSDIKTDDTGADVIHIGNAMNYLADAGTATGKTMADFASRMGGVLIPKGVATGQVLGLATTLEELSVTAERGSTAVNTIFQKMLTNVEGFAKVAGTSTEEFAHLLNTNIWAAFNKFIVGTQKGGAQATEFAKILQDTELSGSGASEVISKLAANQDMLAKYVDAGTQKLKESGAITTEVSKKNNNAAAILDKLGKIGVNAFERIALAGMDAIEVVGPWLLGLTNLSGKVSEYSGTLQTLGTLLLVYYANTIRATVATAAATTAQIANRVAVAASVPIYAMAGTGLRLMTIGHQLLTGQITLGTAATRVATMAQKSLNAVWLANPLGVVIAGLSAAVGLLKLYSDNTKEALALEKSKHKLSVDLAKATDDNQKAQGLLNEKIAGYNSLSETERANLRNEIKLRQHKLQMQLMNIKAQATELSQQAAAPTIWQKFMALIKGGMQGANANFGAEMASAAAENMRAVNEQFNGQIKELENSAQDYDRILLQISKMEKALTDPKNGNSGGSGSGDGSPGKPGKNKAGESMFSQRHKYEVAEEEYDRKRAEQKASYAEAEDKYDKKRLDDLKSYLEAENEFDLMMAERQAKKDLETTNNALNMGEATGQITPDAANRAKLDAEEAYLMQLLLIRKSYGQQTDDLEQSLAETSIDRARMVTQIEKENVERQKQASVDLQVAKAEALEQGVGALKSYFKETSLIYKALFVVEKAAAIANVIIKSQAEIASTSAYAATLGPVAGPAYAAAMTAAIKIRTGLSVATIAAQAIQAFVPGREEGGYTDLTSLKKSKSPAGYVSQPTLFDLGPRSFIAGEKYKTEYVIPGTMLQDPYFAAQAQEMEMFRTTGRRPSGAGRSGADPAQSKNIEALLMAQIDESRQLRIAMQSGAIRVAFNTTEFEDRQNFIDYIRSETAT